MNALLDPDQKQLVCEKCGGKMKKCSHQDLRELRTKKGETTFEEKNIVQCIVCKESMSSEKIVMKKLENVIKMRSTDMSRLCKEPDLFNRNSLWTKSSVQSKHAICMQVQQMRDGLNELKGKLPKLGTQKFTERCFINTVLNNLHSEHHVRQCFKENCKECRMKLPKPEMLSPELFGATRNLDFVIGKGIPLKEVSSPMSRKGTLKIAL